MANDADIQTARAILDAADLAGRCTHAGSVALMQGITTALARVREEALAPVITAWKLLDREMNSCDYCCDPAVSNAADAVEAALGVQP